MRGSMIIVGFFIAGIVVGVLHLLPPMSSMGNISLVTLYALIFLVGFMIGNDAEIFKKFKRLNRLYMLLPLMTIVGTLAGCAITTLLLPHRSLSECLAVGSGMGYYSLSSVLITQYKGAELGTVALLANIVRAAGRAAHGAVVWQAGPHLGGRRHYHGHHAAHHHPRLRQGPSHRLHLPRLHRRFQRAAARHLLRRIVAISGTGNDD